MNTKQIILLSLLILLSTSTYSQWIGFEEIDDTKVSSWINEDIGGYQYVYHFGASEMESDLLILVGDGYAFAQIRSGSFNEDATAWVMDYRNLTNVRIIGNHFYSDQTNGEFVEYDYGDEKVKGLKVIEPWSGVTGEGEYEIGTWSFPVEDYFSGKFIQASSRPLTLEELKGMTKSDLKIMRNEIFARYGYTFRPGGAMDTYFRKQDWYEARYEDVNGYLTLLEQHNISLIRQVEQE